MITKIPKNSSSIPVAGGETCSLDFAYVLAYENGTQAWNLVVQTKDKEKRELFVYEQQKIKHAQALLKVSIMVFRVA